jgi:uncharacterized protein YggE
MTAQVVTDEVVVRGQGEVRALPDRAIVQATIDGEGNTRDDAYANAARLATHVDSVLVQYEGALDRTTTAALLVHPKTRWRRGESVRTGWRAARSSVLEVTELPRLGELMAELTAAGAALVGPTWQLDTDNAAHTEARRAAAEDARRRADAYAGALGLQVVGVAWVAEPGLRQGAGDGGYGGPMMRSMAAPAGAGGADAESEMIDVSVEEITVSASVEVGFRFSTPGT